MADWKRTSSETFENLKKEKAIEMANAHARMPQSPVERSLDKGRVKKLVQVIKNGYALPFQWATVEFDGGVVRMNGQHSSNAILELGDELPDGLTFHVDRYVAPTHLDLVQLFRQFDQRWSMRSSQDISGAYQGGVKEIAQCNRKAMKLAAEAIGWSLRIVEGSPDIPTGDEIYSLLLDDRFTDFFLWFNRANNGRKELLKKEVAAAMFQTFEASQNGATEFWREVSAGVDNVSDDEQPSAVLITELSRAAEDRDYREKEFPQSASYYKKAIKAWNAFCAGHSIRSLKVTKGKGWPTVSRPGDDDQRAAA